VRQRIRRRVEIILRLWDRELRLVQKNDPEVVRVLGSRQREGGGRPELHNEELTDPRQNIFLGDEFRGGDVVSMNKQQPP
jgi:hypothetical protein